MVHVGERARVQPRTHGGSAAELPPRSETRVAKDGSGGPCSPRRPYHRKSTSRLEDPKRIVLDEPLGAADGGRGDRGRRAVKGPAVIVRQPDKQGGRERRGNAVTNERVIEPRRFAAKIVAEHTDGVRQGGDFLHRERLRLVEFNRLPRVASGPGEHFALQQAPIYPYQELAAIGRPALREGPAGIDDSDGTRPHIVGSASLRERATASERKLQEKVIRNMRRDDHHVAAEL